jgi:putative alpha-1,2-mannosidase
VFNKKRAFAEGNAWQYTWYVPQDVYGLIRKFRANQRFAEKLDSLFTLKRVVYLGHETGGFSKLSLSVHLLKQMGKSVNI